MTPSNTPTNTFAAKAAAFAKRPQVIVAAAVIGVGLLFALVFTASLSSVRTEGVRRENALEARYSDNQNKLSSYVITIKEELQIADRKTDRLDEVLTNAVTGRYDSSLTATTPGQSNQLISALVEAYPDLSGLDTYDSLLLTISSGRAEFRNAQSVLLDEISNYESWSDQGLWHSWMVDRAGFPSNRLEARIGDDVVYGADALEQMKRIVVDADTKEDFRTGETGPLDLNPSRGPN